MIDIFTDGGCSGNPGPGAWAYVLREAGSEAEDSGFDPATTNNRMELTAVIRALGRARESLGSGHEAEIRVHTDSQYVKNGITDWIKKWKKNGWLTAGKDPVKNRELWERLDALASELKPSWIWVRGHSGHPENERCDALVRSRMGI
jgi:ribonuclease HI